MRHLLCLLPLLLAAEGVDPAAFRAQWYDQGAEITRYELRQDRYGEVRAGDAVLIFVTEPLDIAQQVKSDDPAAAAAVPGLKCNRTRHFITGLYPYSTMTTVLQPIDTTVHPHALKVSTSVQEWCGHVFEQLNRQEGGWRFRLFSYFQSEGDQDRELAEAWLEDELWPHIRLDPAGLPTGDFTCVPGALFRRFAHLPAAAVSASGAWEELGDGRRRYTVRYAQPERRLSIDIEAAFPWRIEAWSETAGGRLTTATATHRLHDPYWQHNHEADRARRTGLGLDPGRAPPP